MSEIMDPMNTIAQSCRVRLARNYADVPFPQRMKESDYEQIIARTENALIGEDYTVKRMAQLSRNARGCLVEAHVISPELAAKDEAAVLISEDKTVSVMVGEEDHLRVQTLLPGLQLGSAMELADHVDRIIERKERFAFDRQWGYLTACPTNTGTGMRASVMLHLAGLSMLSKTGEIIHAVSQLGLTVRGLYGEGSEAGACMYQLSNQITLGLSEEDAMEKLNGAVGQLVAKERELRAQMLSDASGDTTDKLWRSYGALKYARRLDTAEASRLISNVRFGAVCGVIPEAAGINLVELLFEIMPAHIASRFSDATTPEKRDIRRADYIRSVLKENEKAQP